MLTTHLITARALSRDQRAVVQFWQKVRRAAPSEDCWRWASDAAEESPTMSVGRRRVQVSRIAWFAVTGEYPLGTNCRHRCGNPLCVRPSHMTWRIGRRAALDIELHSSGYGSQGNATVTADEEQAAATLADAEQSNLFRRDWLGAETLPAMPLRAHVDTGSFRPR